MANDKDKSKPENLADPKAVEDKARKQRMGRDQEIKDLRELLEHPAFRRFIWRLFQRFGLFRSSMTGNSHTFFNEGRRNEGLWLLAEIAEADEKGVATIFTEHATNLKDYGGI